MPKRKPVKRGGVNDSAACLAAIVATIVGLGVAATMDHPPCKGQCVITAAEARKADPKPVILYRDAESVAFRRAVSVVAANEGGFVAVDGASGAPALYGINRKWHPQAYDQAARLTETHGEAAGRAYAKRFYRENFWDRYDIASLDPAAQVIVLDGVVNHSSAFSRRLVDAARQGADARALLVMRWQEYRRLALAKPADYGQSYAGWVARLEATAKAAAS